MQTMPKLRNIEQCHKWLKENDPESPITSRMLRDMVASGVIPHVRHGRKLLIDLDVLPESLADWARKGEGAQRETIIAVSEKPLPATERASAGGKYGQVRAFS